MPHVVMSVPPTATLPTDPPGWSGRECQRLWADLQRGLDSRNLPPEHPTVAHAIRGPFVAAFEAAVRRDLDGVRRAVEDGLAELLFSPVGDYRPGRPAEAN